MSQTRLEDIETMSSFVQRTTRLACVCLLLTLLLFAFCKASLEVIPDEDLSDEVRQDYRLRDALATLDVYLHPQIQLRQSKQYGGWYVQVKQTDNVGKEASSTTMMIPRNTVLMHVPNQAQLGPPSALCRPPYVHSKASTALYDVLPNIGATALCLLHHLAAANHNHHHDDSALTAYLDLLPAAGTPNAAFYTIDTLLWASQYQPFIHAAGAVVQDVHDMMETVERYCRQQWHASVRENYTVHYWPGNGDDDANKCHDENDNIINADERSENDIATSLQECLELQGDPRSTQ